MAQTRALLSKYLWRILIATGALIGLYVFAIFVSQMTLSSMFRGIAANKATGLAAMGFPPSSYSSYNALPNADSTVVRDINLGIEAQSFEVAQPRVQEITEQFGGFVEQLNVHRQLDARPWLDARLRLPADSVDRILLAIRELGSVQQETESSENTNAEKESIVSQVVSKRADLKRLNDIIQHHAGSLSDTVGAEEKLSQRRNELNDLEKQLAKLDSRIEYALVELRITEQYRAHLDWRAMVSISDLRNSFVEGLAAVLESFAAILGILFHYGLPVAFWFAILYWPFLALWRRYRHTHPLSAAPTT